MIRLGEEVLFLETSHENLRNGEGSFVRLRGGRIMYLFTQFYGTSRTDAATSRLAACYSDDEGESWSAPVTFLDKPDGALNIMSVSLLELQNGEIGLLFLQKMQTDKGKICVPLYSYSTDGGKSFSTPTLCFNEQSSFVVNNDRIIQLKSGRLIFPLADHGLNYAPGKIRLCYSDDNGRTWHLTGVKAVSPYNDRTGFQEPGLFELDDGRLWLYFRTGYGHQYQSFSSDNGESFTPPCPNLYFTSPDSPMLIKRVGDYTLSIFNPMGYNCLSSRTESWGSVKRTPFVCAISVDGGKGFDSTDKSSYAGEMADFAKKCFFIEDDTSSSYCYPAVIEVAGGFLISYYHSNGTTHALNCAKITKITWSELERALK